MIKEIKETAGMNPGSTRSTRSMRRRLNRGLNSSSVECQNCQSVTSPNSNFFGFEGSVVGEGVSTPAQTQSEIDTAYFMTIPSGRQRYILFKATFLSLIGLSSLSPTTATRMQEGTKGASVSMFGERGTQSLMRRRGFYIASLIASAARAKTATPKECKTAATNQWCIQETIRVLFSRSFPIRVRPVFMTYAAEQRAMKIGNYTTASGFPLPSIICWLLKKMAIQSMNWRFPCIGGPSATSTAPIHGGLAPNLLQVLLNKRNGPSSLLMCVETALIYNGRYAAIDYDAHTNSLNGVLTERGGESSRNLLHRRASLRSQASPFNPMGHGRWFSTPMG
ncbi:hypothetical protein BKA70DRAFT_1242041 [Coprinopsis sp. MPI-PUGE-AT-0042]|nr:hypothetical protein BKA70DRAFT_1242041 [Coprinopsis sp. MPI-PUGE-AT-0042]